jgi:hypothetical protein
MTVALARRAAPGAKPARLRGLRRRLTLHRKVKARGAEPKPQAFGAKSVTVE